MEDIFDGIVKSIYWILWEIIGAVSAFLENIVEVFSFFAGLNTGEEEGFSFFSFFQEPIFLQAFWWFFGIAFFLMFMLSIYAIVKQDYFGKDGPTSKGPIFRDMAVAFTLFILITPILLVVTNIVSYLVIAVPLLLGTGEEIVGLGTVLFETSFGENMAVAFGLGEEYTRPWETVDFETFYSEVFSGEVEFYWYLFLVGAIFVARNLLIALVELVKRVFSIVFLYILAPFEIANYVTDEGARFRRWKDQMANQIVSFLAIVIAFFVFLALVDIVYPLVSSLGNIYVVILLMGGSLLVKDTCKIVAEITGANDIFQTTTKEVYKETQKVVEKGKSSPQDAYEKRSQSNKDANKGERKNSPISGTRRTVRSTPVRVSKKTNVKRDIDKTLDGSSKKHGRQNESNFNQGFSKNSRPKVDSIQTKIENRSIPSTNKGEGSQTSFSSATKRKSSPPKIVSNAFRKPSMELGPPPIGESETKKENDFQKSLDKLDSQVNSKKHNPEELKNASLEFAKNLDNEGKEIKANYEKNEGHRQQIKSNLEPEELNKAKKHDSDYKKAQFDYDKTSEYIKKEASSGNTNSKNVEKFKKKAQDQREMLKKVAEKAEKYYSSKNKGGS